MTPLTVPTEAAQAPFYDPIRQVMDTLDNIIRRKLLQQPTGYMEFVTLLTEGRMYLYATSVLAEDLWNEVRKSPTLTDFIVEITRELYVRCWSIQEASGKVYDWLAQLVTESMVGFISDKSAMDTDFLTQFNHAGLEAVLTANPWLVVLNLASMVPAVQSPVTVKELEPPREGNEK